MTFIFIFIYNKNINIDTPQCIKYAKLTLRNLVTGIELVLSNVVLQ